MINSLLPEDPIKRLSPKEQQEWNRFLSFVKERGMEGSKDLDVRNKNLGASMFDEFKKANPDVSINYDIVSRVQNEIQLLTKQARDFAARKGDLNAQNLNNNISPVDGWFGSQTSQYRFPSLEVQTVDQSGKVLSVEDKGLMNGDFVPTQPGIQAGLMPSKTGGIPRKTKDGYEIFQTADGRWMYPHKGDPDDLRPYKY